jgi:hypothetical protein
MKIGTIDISYRMLIYAGLIVFGVIFLWTTWNSKKELRQESYYRDTILRGLFDDKPEAQAAAIDACRGLLSHKPSHVAGRLYLGTLLMRNKENVENLKEAQATFEQLATDPAATPQEKAWACVSAGVAVFNLNEAADANKAANESEKLFLKALEADKDSADAMTNLALAQMFKSGSKGVSSAAGWTAKALAAKDAGSLKARSQLYNLNGMIQLNNQKPIEALGEFRKSKAVRPKRDDIADNIRMAAISGVTQKNLTPEDRRELLKRIEAEMSQYGKSESTALTAAGRGWMILKNAPDYMAQNGPYANALRLLSTAINKEPASIQGYYSKTVLLDERISDIGAKLVSRITGINGETPPLSLWKTPDKSYFSNEDTTLLNELRNVLTEQETMWKQFADRTQKMPEKVEARLRQLICLRRLAWCVPDRDASQQATFRDRATKVADELLKLDPENGAVHFAAGQLLFDKGNYAGAFQSFSLAKEKKFASESLDRLIAGLGQKPEIVDVWPAETRRGYGVRPLIGGTLKVLKGSGPLKEATLSIGKNTVTPVITGSQVFYVPDDDSTLDGDHEVSIAVVDEFGGRTEFPKFSFGIDKRPPAIKVLPEDGAQIETKQIWTITLSDVAGIEQTQTQVTLKSEKPSKINRELIKDGRYKVSVDAQQPVKINSFCGESFKIGLGSDMVPGEYSLIVSTADMNGNIATVTRSYTVKPPAK